MRLATGRESNRAHKEKAMSRWDIQIAPERSAQYVTVIADETVVGCDPEHYVLQFVPVSSKPSEIAAKLKESSVVRAAKRSASEQHKADVMSATSGWATAIKGLLEK